MVKLRLSLACLVLGMVVTSSAQAGNARPPVLLGFGTYCVPNCIAKWCCDDYRPKCEPGVCGVKQFCCDDYCPKCEPCVRGVKRFCCDDYLPKCMPKVCAQPCGPNAHNLKCGTPEAPCGHSR